MDLIAELKRRNVIRVGLAYLVLSWLLPQIGDVLFEVLRPDDAALTQTVNFGNWPSKNGNYLLAQIAAIEGDVGRVVKHIRAAADEYDLRHQFFAVDPSFAEYRDEPRLVDIAEETRERALAERRKLRGVNAPI